MAPENSISKTDGTVGSLDQIDPAQTLRATTALLRKIHSDQANGTQAAEKPSLLADADEEDVEDEVPVWLILTTKKHIIDKKRLKPGKIQLPHPYLDIANPNLRVCLITADPQRYFKDLIAHPAFPTDISKRIGRVIGLSKLKAKYKSFEDRRQLLSEYDVFLADDRIVTSMPQLLGKTFYRSSSKRPIPVNLQGKRQNLDEQGNKRRKLSEGGSRVVREEVKPTSVAHEIQRALSSALVHLVPSTTTAVRVGKATMEPQQLQKNVEAVTREMVERFVPQKWRNLRAVHIKGPETAALPIWLADELWEDDKDVLEEPLPEKETKKGAKRKISASENISTEVLEVPGPDGKMRRLERTTIRRKSAGQPAIEIKTIKSQKSVDADETERRSAESAEKAARKEALQKQKKAVKFSVKSALKPTTADAVKNSNTQEIGNGTSKAGFVV